jgi:tRNA(Ile2) C34 agmatinyltransferase TiaS
MNAFCANCGAEVESDDSLGKGAETYKCKACGTYGTIGRRVDRQHLTPAGKEPMFANFSLNILDLIKLEARPERRCPVCGAVSYGEEGQCSFCGQRV